MFIVSVTLRFTVYLAADKWVAIPSVTKIFLILSEKLFSCFHIHHRLMFGYVSLHSVTIIYNSTYKHPVIPALFLPNCSLYIYSYYSQSYASIIGSGLDCIGMHLKMITKS